MKPTTQVGACQAAGWMAEACDPELHMSCLPDSEYTKQMHATCRH